ncbi:TPA: hypothetical protein ACJ2PF_004325 [Klebsiella pneumoniae]|uniref:hypothetical protein n=1 Tax=Klebsiella pneumoniae TaxID=573 RepID=UPI00192CDFB9|nr:hypothetical protein [Klebsiella pneumoniae]MBL4509147.1 hypothetical protein [Klebsiella pneumoniae]HBQ4906494.1 hypothetical protein [Klebsiella pneumoniae]HBR7475971.1 hypothetical protein [Klebsiella pneumoniae]HCU1096252.1 hypothetical protein [Klebsiella pneumoniae]
MNVADKIALFSAIGGWVSGVGALAAVITSLYIANKKVKVRLSCHVAEKVILTPGMGEENNRESGIAFEVVNLTTLPITINTIGWRFDRRYYWHQMFGDRMSHALPKRLDYGESAFFWVSLEGKEDEWFNDFATELNSKGAKAKRVECAISTSTGGPRYFPVDEKLKAKFRGLISSAI